MCDVDTVTKIAKCLNVSPGQVSLNEHKIVTRSNHNSTVTGFINILNVLAQESDSEAAANSTSSPEVAAQVYQWIEFAVLFVAPGSKDKHVAQQLLRDFNNLLMLRSYLVQYFITVADLAVYYAIYDLVKSLTPVEKENHLNLSRWFNHIQRRPEVRQGGDIINFTTIYLHGWATGTHL